MISWLLCKILNEAFSITEINYAADYLINKISTLRLLAGEPSNVEIDPGTGRRTASPEIEAGLVVGLKGFLVILYKQAAI